MNILESAPVRWLAGSLVVMAIAAVGVRGLGVTQQQLVEAAAATCGVIGTLLLATRSRWAGWGFVAFLGSNIGWLWFSHAHGHHWMFWQQVAFTISSLVGIFVWLLKDTLRDWLFIAGCVVFLSLLAAGAVEEGDLE